MRNGRLNKRELKRLARIWSDLDALVAEVPADARDGDEGCALTKLSEARNTVGVMLQWQDHRLWLVTSRERRGVKLPAAAAGDNGSACMEGRAA